MDPNPYESPKDHDIKSVENTRFESIRAGLYKSAVICVAASLALTVRTALWPQFDEVFGFVGMVTGFVGAVAGFFSGNRPLSPFLFAIGLVLAFLNPAFVRA